MTAAGGNNKHDNHRKVGNPPFKVLSVAGELPAEAHLRMQPHVSRLFFPSLGHIVGGSSRDCDFSLNGRLPTLRPRCRVYCFHQRPLDHLQICARQAVAFHKVNVGLVEDVQLLEAWALSTNSAHRLEQKAELFLRNVGWYQPIDVSPRGGARWIFARTWPNELSALTTRAGLCSGPRLIARGVPHQPSSFSASSGATCMGPWRAWT